MATSASQLIASQSTPNTRSPFIERLSADRDSSVADACSVMGPTHTHRHTYTRVCFVCGGIHDRQSKYLPSPQMPDTESPNLGPYATGGVFRGLMWKKDLLLLVPHKPQCFFGRVGSVERERAIWFFVRSYLEHSRLKCI